MLEHATLYVDPILRFVGVTIMALIAAGVLRISGRLLGPNGAGDIEEARLRQDRRRALQTKEESHGG